MPLSPPLDSLFSLSPLSLSLPLPLLSPLILLFSSTQNNKRERERGKKSKPSVFLLSSSSHNSSLRHLLSSTRPPSGTPLPPHHRHHLRKTFNVLRGWMVAQVGWLLSLLWKGSAFHQVRWLLSHDFRLGGCCCETLLFVWCHRLNGWFILLFECF
ncbi:hypothetical protein QJS10_CPA08g00641 [Acorus calamus]|uniref:Uncharacterized protein n=1 Tax=Acorus calamus TaxID=4465 RepID=A0AAV9ECF7_ACOCL|nr:hypothetical protein QJS10_CPA08g00641 [Acorus calamus]